MQHSERRVTSGVAPQLAVWDSLNIQTVIGSVKLEGYFFLKAQCFKTCSRSTMLSRTCDVDPRTAGL